MHDLDQIRLETEPESDLNESDVNEGDFEGGELDTLEAADGFETTEPENEEIDATELLAATSDAELDNFLGGLMKRAGSFLRSPAGSALKGLLRKTAKRLLPMAGAAIGTFFGGPVGTAVGRTIASKAGQVLGLEVEGLSAQEQDFEVAKGMVRLANAAARNLAASSPQLVARDPVGAARQAFASAARVYAPGLLQGMGQRGVSGRWVRHGRRIVIFGA